MHIDEQIDDFIVYGDEYEDCYDMDKYCPICGSLMETKTGKYGKFRGCSGYPKCSNTAKYQEFGKVI